MTGAGEAGRLGEDAAVRLLRQLGYTLVARNVHSRFGEIDIIAKNARYIVFAEVKTRAPGSIGRPAEAVDARKMHRIIKTAEYWLLNNPCLLQPRFDVIEVILAEGKSPACNHIENAFGVK